MQANFILRQPRNSWQISFADLLALLLCFIVLQYALQLPATYLPNQSHKQIVKWSSKRAITWFQSHVDKRIIVLPQSPSMIVLTGQLDLLQDSVLNSFGCSISVVSNRDIDIDVVINLQKKIRKNASYLFVTAGMDSRVSGVTLQVDLGDCK
jgi:hypothetical protein